MARPGSQLSVLFELFAAEQRVGALVMAAMADAELRPDEYAVYSVLFDEGPQTPTDLAHRVGMPPTSMSHFVRALLRRGHAERETVAGDRRSYRLVLTPAGLAAHAGASRAFAEADRRFQAALEMDPDVARRTLVAITEAARLAELELIADAMQATA